MIQIRNGLFETNSSSCHVFVYKHEDVTVPSSVELRPNKAETMLDVMFNDYFIWYSPDTYYGNELETFIDSLYSIGVKTITCSDEAVAKLIEDRKHNYRHRCTHGVNSFSALKNILFGNNTKLITIEDFEVSDEFVENQFGEEYDYVAYRLS